MIIFSMFEGSQYLVKVEETHVVNYLIILTLYFQCNKKCENMSVKLRKQFQDNFHKAITQLLIFKTGRLIL